MQNLDYIISTIIFINCLALGMHTVTVYLLALRCVLDNDTSQARSCTTEELFLNVTL